VILLPTNNKRGAKDRRSEEFHLPRDALERKKIEKATNQKMSIELPMFPRQNINFRICEWKKLLI
jgi:hypothetical protein